MSLLELTNLSETLSKEILDEHIPVLMEYLGIDVEIYRHVAGIYDTVYGVAGSADEVISFPSRVMFTDLDFGAVDDESASILSTGHVYINTQEVVSGSDISFEDNKISKISGGLAAFSLGERITIAGSLHNNVEAEITEVDPYYLVTDQTFVTEIVGVPVVISSTKIVVNDIIAINRLDGKSRKFKVISKETIGFTQEIVTRYAVSALGD